MGSQLFYPLIITTLLLLMFTRFLILRKDFMSLKYRVKDYLCLKYSIKNYKSYISSIGTINQSLTAIYPLTKLPPPIGPSSSIVHRSSKVLQNFLHISYMKKSLINKYCSLTQKIILSKLPPYKTKMQYLLNRSFDGSVMIKKKKVKIWLPSISSKQIFYIQSSIKNRYSISPAVKSREISKEALASLRLHSGFPLLD